MNYEINYAYISAHTPDVCTLKWLAVPHHISYTTFLLILGVKVLHMYLYI